MTVGRDLGALKFGPGKLYIAPLGTAEPAGLSTAPNAAFVDIGYTKEGNTLTLSRETVLFKVAERRGEVGAHVASEENRLSLDLAQSTARNWQIASNGGTITSGGNFVTYEPPEAGAEVAVMLLWDDADTPANNTRRLLIREAFQVGDSEIAHIKPDGEDDYSGVPVEFALLEPDSGALPYKAWFSSALSGTA